jgi:hypothetical protein
MVNVPSACSRSRPPALPKPPVYAHEVNHRSASAQMDQAEMLALPNYLAAQYGTVKLNAFAQVTNAKDDVVDALD